MSAWIDDERCEEFDLDRKKVASIARRLSSAAKEAQAMGLCIFGGSGHGTLRYTRGERGGDCTTVADLEGNFDGGDGGDSW